MYRILIAGPDGCYPGTSIDANKETMIFFNSEQATCFSSLNPSDLEHCDGVAVPGGPPDVDPAYYGQENTACGIIDQQMDAAQMAMIRRAVELGKPIMGFCRGHQLVSVYFGSTLIQDIDCSDEHRNSPDKPCFHPIYSVPNTFMYNIFGDSIKGNSLHHQAIGKLPECLEISQFWCKKEENASGLVQQIQSGVIREGSGDCVIEAVYHKSYPFVGIQWHPELSGKLHCHYIEPKKIRDYFYQMLEKSINQA